MKDVKQVIAELKANESNEVRTNLVVKNVNVADLDEWKRVSLTLNNPVPAYVPKDANSDEYVKGESRVIFISLYSIAALFSDNEDNGGQTTARLKTKFRFRSKKTAPPLFHRYMQPTRSPSGGAGKD